MIYVFRTYLATGYLGRYLIICFVFIESEFGAARNIIGNIRRKYRKVLKSDV